MNYRALGVIGLILYVFLVAPALAKGVNPGSGGNESRTATRITDYDPRLQCPVVCRGEAPLSAVLEDGLAYLLDIPLALLSPVTCPIVAPIMECLDSGPDRSYARPRTR